MYRFSLTFAVPDFGCGNRPARQALTSCRLIAMYCYMPCGFSAEDPATGECGSQRPETALLVLQLSVILCECRGAAEPLGLIDLQRFFENHDGE
jgi:hypothetical protein